MSESLRSAGPPTNKMVIHPPPSLFLFPLPSSSFFSFFSSLFSSPGPAFWSGSGISRFSSSWDANSKTWDVLGTEGIPTKDR
jgi:hypothetical protein